MDYITLSIRIFISILFLSSSYAKFKNVEEHILIIKEYRIISTKWVKTFAYIEISLEFILGVFLFLGLLQKLSLILAIIFMLIYIFAISINLLRGRNEINCGCGGIVGNHKMSWLLVLRNLLIIFLIIWLYQYPTYLGSIDAIITNLPLDVTYNFETLLIIILSSLIILTLNIMLSLHNVNKSIKKLL